MAHSAGRPSALCWGEILWDLFPDGRRLGGAPANVAFHLAQLGADVALASQVGDDELGGDALATLAAAGVDTTTIAIDQTRPTGRVNIEISNGEARYSLVSGCAWEGIPATDSVLARASTAGVFCFGLLSQRCLAGRDALRAALQRCPRSCLVVCDPNLRPPHIDDDVLRWSLRAADVVKLNESELGIIERRFAVSDGVGWMITECNVGLVAVTQGARGARLVTSEQHHEHPGFPATVRDTVGCGDGYTAALIAGLLRDLPLSTINAAASRYGAFIATRRGATPVPEAAMLARLFSATDAQQDEADLNADATPDEQTKP